MLTPPSLPLRIRFFGVLTFLGLLLFFAHEAVAAPGSARAAPVNDLVRSAALIGPLGINPFLALAGLGFAATLGWQPPAGFEPFTHPVVWIGLLALGLILQFGRSTKLTKPVAEMLGTSEAFVAVATVVMIMVPHFAERTTTIQEAGVASGLFMITVGLAVVSVLLIMRLALDILIWLSPIPFVDFLFQIAKLGITIGLVVLAVLAPWVALVLSTLLIIATALGLRWAIRTARFGLTLVWDLSIGRFGARLPLPRDQVVKDDLGPFDVFVLEVEGLKKKSAARLDLRAGRWFIEQPRALGTDKSIPLGDADKAKVTPGFLGTELSLPHGTILLPPRYRHLTEELTKATGAELGRTPSLLSGHRVALRQPQAQSSAS